VNNAEEARRMLRAHRYGALSTLSKKFDGYPFGSITPYLTDHDGSLLILISTLAEHTRNIQHDPRVSLITHDQRNPHIQTQGRVTVVGSAQPEPERDKTGQRYLRYFPEAETYFAMHDFSFYRIRPLAIRYIGGFGRIHWVNMENYAVPDAADFAQIEDALLAEVNATSSRTLCRVLRQRHGVHATETQAVGIDCDGLDLRHADQTWRLDFPETVRPGSIESALVKLLAEAP
jgi:putative heme iron utilization protein